MNQPITPDDWGPHGWKFLHYITLGYPNNPTIDEKNKYKNFFISLQHVLPCSVCSKHYGENIEKYSLHEALNNQESLMKWLIDVHNDVNQSKGKKIYDYDEALALYTNPSLFPDYVQSCFKLFVLLILLFFIYKIIKK